MATPAQPPQAQDPAGRIREQLSTVTRLREQAHATGLDTEVHSIKQWQARRFANSYRDFLLAPPYAAATRFFLNELYGERDFRERDRQFSRIAGAIDRLFPAAVTDLTVDLAETHALTEGLDHEMAQHWLRSDPNLSPAARYVDCWRRTGKQSERLRQLAVVQHMGRELQRLTRTTGLRLTLKLMRRPAKSAGLAELQTFLERGFDAFAQMGNAKPLLDAIQSREAAWIGRLFDGAADEVAAALARDMAETGD